MDALDGGKYFLVKVAGLLGAQNQHIDGIGNCHNLSFWA